MSFLELYGQLSHRLCQRILHAELAVTILLALVSGVGFLNAVTLGSAGGSFIPWRTANETPLALGFVLMIACVDGGRSGFCTGTSAAWPNLGAEAGWILVWDGGSNTFSGCRSAWELH